MGSSTSKSTPQIKAAIVNQHEIDIESVKNNLSISNIAWFHKKYLNDKQTLRELLQLLQITPANVMLYEHFIQDYSKYLTDQQIKTLVETPLEEVTEKGTWINPLRDNPMAAMISNIQWRQAMMDRPDYEYEHI